jgi:hypothetical protein
LLREPERAELVLSQISKVEAERDLALRQAAMIETTPEGNNVSALWCRLRGIGAEISSVPSSEAFFRCFGNRREVAVQFGGGIIRRGGFKASIEAFGPALGVR